MPEVEDRIAKLEELMKTHQHRDFDGSVSIDSSSSSTSAVRVYRTSSTQTIATGGTPVKVQFNAESFDILGEFDSTTNYRFTAQAAGKYLVSASLELNSLGLGNSMFSYIYKNGVEQSHRQQQDFGAGTDVYTPITDVVDLAVGGYIEIFVSQNSGSDRFLAQDINWLTINKV